MADITDIDDRYYQDWY